MDVVEPPEDEDVVEPPELEVLDVDEPDADPELDVLDVLDVDDDESPSEPQAIAPERTATASTEKERPVILGSYRTWTRRGSGVLATFPAQPGQPREITVRRRRHVPC